MPIPVPYTSNGANGTQTSPPSNSYTTVEGNAQALAYAFAVATWDGETLSLQPLAPGLAATALALPVPEDRTAIGMAVTQDNTDYRQVDVAAGQYQIGGLRYVFAGGSATVADGDAAEPRFDLITVDTSGTLAVVAGTPNLQPVVPATPADTLALAIVGVPANATSITATIAVLPLNAVALPPAPSGAIPFSSGAGYATDSPNFIYDSQRILRVSTIAQFGFQRITLDGPILISTSLAVADSSSTARVLALPPVATLPDGWSCTIINLGGNGTTVTTDAANEFNEGFVASLPIPNTNEAYTVRYCASQGTFYALSHQP